MNREFNAKRGKDERGLIGVRCYIGAHENLGPLTTIALEKKHHFMRLMERQMKRLIICDTFYQIMVAVQLSTTLFSKDETDIWISDHSLGSEQISIKLREEEIVNDVKFIKTKEIDYENNWAKKIVYMLTYGFGLRKITFIPNYDEIIFYGLSIMKYGIEEIYRRRKHKVIWSMFEEGLLSYETDFCMGRAVKGIENIKRLFRKSIIRDKVRNYYCFIPNMKKTNRQWNLVQIPQINEKIIPVFKKIFDFKGISFSQKYIYFASSYDIDGYPFGEIDCLLKISELVGKDNIIVKVHPRDMRNIYKDNGFKVLQADGIPWEIVQICSNIEDKILLTIVSGSFITVNSIYESSVQCRFLLSLVKDENKDEKFLMRERDILDTINRLHENGKCLNVNIGTI